MDYAAIATAISSELTTGLPVFALVIGLAIGIPMVIKLFKRAAR